MAIHWRLKSYLATHHEIYRIRDFQELVKEKMGIIISLQHLSTLVKGKPKSIKLKTMEIICGTLECDLTEFCEIKSGKKKEKTIRQLSYQTTPNTKRGIREFPNPHEYKS